MGTTVISHRKPCRKRRSALAWAARRFGALAITVAALVTASWLAPQVRRSPAPLRSAPRQAEAPVLPRAWPELAEVDVSLDLAGAPARSQRRARRGVPLNAAARAEPDGYEILSAAELAAISQARN